MPTCPVQHQHNLLGGARSGCTRKHGEFYFKKANTDTTRQVKDGAPRGGMHKADDIAPDKAMLDHGHRPLTNWRPDAPLDGFEADA